MLRYLFKLLDFLMDHWDHVLWAIPGVVMLNVYLFSGWAWLSSESWVVITTIALTLSSVTLVTLLYVPELLKKRFPRPFAFRSNTLSLTNHRLSVPIFILNRSTRDNIVLEFNLFLKSKNHPEMCFEVNTTDIEPNLGPQLSTKGLIFVEFNLTKYVTDSGFDVWLRVIDRVSGRWVTIKVPGSFPEGFFYLT